MPAPGQLGTLQYTPGFEPRRFFFDFSLAKHTQLTETTSLEFRWEAFNVTNHTNFAVPGDNPVGGGNIFDSNFS